MFNLYTGSYRTLENKLVQDLAEQKRNDPLSHLLVLSPSPGLMDRLQRQLAQQGSYLNIHFLTFYALADRLLQETSPAPDRVVGESILYTEIIRDLLEGRSPVEFINRSYLHSTGRPLARGVPGALAETLRDLRDSGARVVDALKAALEGHLGDATPETAPTLELYARVYEVLQKFGLRTPSDQLRRAATQAPKSPWIAQQKAIFLCGFYDLTGVQLDFVLSLADHSDARIYFPYEEGNPAYAYAEKLLKDPALQRKVGPSLSFPHVVSGNPSKKAIDGSPITPSGMTAHTTELWNCSGVQDEVWLAAKKILLLTDQGVPFSEMVLTARSLTSYLSAVREIFQANQIPYSIDVAEPVGAWPIIKRARELLDKSRDVIPADRKRGSIDSRLRGNDGYTWSAHVRWAENLLQQLGSVPNVKRGPDPIREGLLEAVRSLADLDVLRQPVSRDHFLDVLNDKLDHLTLPLSPSGNAGVQVVDIMGARGQHFKAAFVLGLNEKSFPRLIREDPFLSDAARSRLSSALGCRLSRKMDGYQEERLLFHLATTLADDFLLLMTQRSDEEGKALIPSLYLQEVMDRHSGESRNPDKQTSLDPGLRRGDVIAHLPRTFLEKWRTVPVEHWTPKEVSIALNRKQHDPVPLYKALGWEWEVYQTLKAAQQDMENFRGGLGARDGRVGKTVVLGRLMKEGFSPHSLEELAECPFRYFARKVLGLTPIEEDVREGELAPDALGKLIHSILEEFYKRLTKGRHSGVSRNPDQNWTPASAGVTSDWDSVLDQSCRTCFKAFEKDHADLYPVIWTATQQNIRTRLRAFLKQDLAELAESGYWPKETELEREGKIPELGDLVFQGRIDRLDAKQEAGKMVYRVIDYKTGRDKPGKTENLILKGSFLQLPLYLGLAQAQEAAIYNLQELEKGGEPRTLGADFWKEHGKKLAENIQGLVSLVREGIFYIRPGDDVGQIYCEWCDYATLCRKNHQPTRHRSLNDPIRKTNDNRLS